SHLCILGRHPLAAAPPHSLAPLPSLRHKPCALSSDVLGFFVTRPAVSLRSGWDSLCSEVVPCAASVVLVVLWPLTAASPTFTMTGSRCRGFSVRMTAKSEIGR